MRLTGFHDDILEGILGRWPFLFDPCLPIDISTLDSLDTVDDKFDDDSLAEDKSTVESLDSPFKRFTAESFVCVLQWLLCRFAVGFGNRGTLGEAAGFVCAGACSCGGVVPVLRSFCSISLGMTGTGTSGLVIV